MTVVQAGTVGVLWQELRRASCGGHRLLGRPQCAPGAALAWDEAPSSPGPEATLRPAPCRTLRHAQVLRRDLPAQRLPGRRPAGHLQQLDLALPSGIHRRPRGRWGATTGALGARRRSGQAGTRCARLRAPSAAAPCMGHRRPSPPGRRCCPRPRDLVSSTPLPAHPLPARSCCLSCCHPSCHPLPSLQAWA